MKKIKLITDHIFPYEVAQFSTSRTNVEQLGFKKTWSPGTGHFLAATRLFYRSFTNNVILANRRVVLLLGLFFILYKPRGVALVGYQIIFNFKDNARNRWVVALWKLAVKNVDLLLVHTPQEVDYLSQKFGVLPAKFEFIPFYTEDQDFMGPTADGYIFSAGRMERDFITLLKAVKGTDIPVVIVADIAQKAALEQLATPHTELHFNIPKEQYATLLKGARLVVISLKDGPSSRGQVVYLEAIRYGKPVICSEVGGIVAYVRPEETGWLVPPENSEQLKKAIEACYFDLSILKEVGRKAYQEQHERYSPSVFHRQFNQIIEDIHHRRTATGH